MKTLMVTLCSVNTQAMQNVSLDIRMNWLEAAIDKSYVFSMQAIQKRGDRLDYPFALFVAPEYLFAAPSPGTNHQAGDQRHISESEKELRLQRFKAISKAHTGMIMIPGTVAWQKDFDRAGAKQHHSEGRLGGTVKTVSRKEKQLTQ